MNYLLSCKLKQSHDIFLINLPILPQIKSYTKSKFVLDLVAGLTVGTVLVPQAMAYASLAGMPPIYGLYSALVPLLLYSLFGTSNKLSLGPVALSSLLVLAGVSQIVEPFSEEYIGLVVLLGLMVGVAQFMLGFLRLGFLSNFLSQPVISGFTSAAALIIIGTQLKDALGLNMPRHDHVMMVYPHFIQHIEDIHVLTLCLTLGSILVIYLIKKWLNKLPIELIVLIALSIASYLLNWEEVGVNVIGTIPSGLPDAILPVMTLEHMIALLPACFTVVVIGIIETISIAKAMEAKHKDHTIDANQELKAIGIAKIGGAFFQALPTSASFSRSAINSKLNAQTNISSLISFTVVALVLLFFTPYLYYTPKAVLAAIILLSVVSLFDFKELKRLWRVHREDAWMLIVTFFMTLILGIEYGVMIGVLLSISLILYRTSKPNISILEKIPGTNHYRDADRFDDSEDEEGFLIVRFDEQLYFGNATYFKEQMLSMLSEYPKDVKYFLLNAKNINDIDSSGLTALGDLDDTLEQMGVDLHMCGARGKVRDMLHKGGLMTEPDKHHSSIEYAVKHIKGLVESRNHLSLQINKGK